MAKYLTVSEVADQLRIKPQTIYKWICQRKIPSINLGGRTLFDEAVLKEWVVSRERQPIGRS